MKKTALKAIVALFAVLLLATSVGIISKVTRASSGEAFISSLPSFTMTTVTGRIFNSDSIQGIPLLIIYFHPECEHCRYEISSLVNSGLNDGRSGILMVTFAGDTAARDFISDLGLEDRKSTWVVSDTLFRFSEIFGNRPVPTNIIYDRNRRLVKIWSGETKIEAFITYLNGEA